MSFGFICPTVEMEAVQIRPEPEQQKVIDDYRDAYKKAVGYPPHGLHYIPFPDQAETVAVWLPPEA